ncbi:MAG: ATPase, T2SS/T4P/T4SS family [bacterium]
MPASTLAPALLSPAGLSSLTLGEAMFLVSFWKPLILVIVLVCWALIISRVYDKHAERFRLPREKWNVLHLSLGGLSVIAALAIPLPGEAAFWVGLAVMIVILAADLAIYPMIANKDERVPASQRVNLLSVFDKMAKARDAKKAEKSKGTVKLTIRKPDKSVLAAPNAETPEYELRTVAEGIYLKAMESRAAQLDFGPAGKDGSYAAAMLVDGVRTMGDSLPAATGIKVIDFWKVAGGMDVADRRKRQQTEITVEQPAGRRTVRMTAMGVQGGMRLSMLFDPTAAVLRKPNELGLMDQQMDELKALIADDKRGVVLLAGQLDGGRTTTLYTILSMHDAYANSIQTVEEEPQANLEGIRHQAFDPQAEGATYATTVRSMLRRDPDVLGIAECKDADTAKEVAKGDGERTRMYLTLRADDPMAAVDAYLKLVGDNALAAKHLRGVVAFRLIRKLCTNCKVTYPATPDMVKKLGGDGKTTQLAKKGGQVLIKNKPEVCPMCSGVGFFGQEGIFEVIRLDGEDRDLIAQGNLAGVKANIRKRGIPTLQTAAFRKALTGVTSVEEVQRVLTAAAAPAAAPAQAAAAAPAPAKKA